MEKDITFIPANRSNLAHKLETDKKRMAAYCRVSTDQEDQLSSYEAQVTYYTKFINSHPDYDMAGIFADEGITGTNTKKREQFNRMIKDCKAGKIDMIITKSISRFARNTLDCLNYVRTLKDLGIGVLFEKENINTLDSQGEVLLTILSSLAQDESRSISENATWGIRRRFEQGKVHVNHKKFLGYDKDEQGNLVIDKKQAVTVRRIYDEYLNGKGYRRIAKELEEDKVPKWNDLYNWHPSNIQQILTNEKYKGDALLQKTYTVDFLNKKRAVNDGEVPKYYVKHSHPAIIESDVWEAVQLETIRRKEFAERHGITKVDYSSDKNVLSGKVICGICGKAYRRKSWYNRKTGETRHIWQCSGKYPEKGVVGCESKHVDEEDLKQAFVDRYNEVVENKEEYLERWERIGESDYVWERVMGKRVIEHFRRSREMLEGFDADLFLRVTEKMVVINTDNVDMVLLI